MQTVTIAKITESLQTLPAEKLAVVYDFVSYLREQELKRVLSETGMKTVDLMFASESILSRDWDRPEEDVAWANL
jgi:hypothetical protein